LKITAHCGHVGSVKPSYGKIYCERVYKKSLGSRNKAVGLY